MDIRVSSAVTAVILSLFSFVLGLFVPMVTIPADPDEWQAYAGIASAIVGAAGFGLLWRYVIDTHRLANQAVTGLQATVRTELAKLNIELNRTLMARTPELMALEQPLDGKRRLPFASPEHQLAGMILNYLELVWQQKEVFGDLAVREWLPFQHVLKDVLQMPHVELYWRQEQEAYCDGFRCHVHAIRPDLTKSGAAPCSQEKGAAVLRT